MVNESREWTLDKRRVKEESPTRSVQIQTPALRHVSMTWNRPTESESCLIMLSLTQFIREK